ncbi:MAG: hypothetical protein ABH825_04720 [Candidatus Omnitrophota bacterium]
MAVNVYRKQKNYFLGPLWTAFAMFAIGTLLSAVYLLPIAESALFTRLDRAISQGCVLAHIPGNLPLSYLITLFIPPFFGSVTGVNFIFTRLMFWYANMSGGFAVTLAVLFGALLPAAVFSGTAQTGHYRKYAVLGVGLYVFSILCALGDNSPFYRMAIGWVPGIGGLCWPILYRSIQCFAASLLAGIGINILVSCGPSVSIGRLRRISWVYAIVSVCVVLAVMFKPNHRDEWYPAAEKSARENTHFLNLNRRGAVGIYTPRIGRVKKVYAAFDGPSSGEVRYCDTHYVLPEEGVMAAEYHVPESGWLGLDVDIPPGKFLWVYPKGGSGNIRYWQEKSPCFTFDGKGKWAIRSDVNAINIDVDNPETASLYHKIKNGYMVTAPIRLSLLYWLIAFLIITAGIYILPIRKFGYFFTSIVLLETLFFGAMAFYGCTFNEDRTRAREFLLHNVRFPRPSEHPMFKRIMVEVPSIATNSLLRIATDYPFYDNFCQLGDRFALMGEPPFPIETRFKRALEAALGRVLDDSICFEGESRFRINPAFLDNFSAGYFMSTNRDEFFSDESCVSLPGNPAHYVHINSGALPRVYTMDRVAAASEEEQFNELVTGDLRRAVYVGLDEIVPLWGKTGQDRIAHFKKLQEINPIERIDFSDPNQVEVDANITVPSMLVFTEVWYPGWEASVDGRSARLRRVNYCQRGVWLGKGPHHVRLRFRPLAWRIGLWISLGIIGLMIMALTANVLKKMRHKL